jgi:hypothetical protein
MSGSKICYVKAAMCSSGNAPRHKNAEQWSSSWQLSWSLLFVLCINDILQNFFMRSAFF